jgi:DNA-binding transcriptional regulator PaaX
MILVDLLLTYLDFGAAMVDIFDYHGSYKKSANEYRKWRRESLITSKEIYQLKKSGLINTDDDQTVSLTPKAITKVRTKALDSLEIKIPDKWDQIWRIVIFDIPEIKKSKREYFRRRLQKLGFISLQKSVYCYPHECRREVVWVIKTYDIEKYTTYMEVTDIVTGKNLFDIFSKRNIL